MLTLKSRYVRKCFSMCEKNNEEEKASFHHRILDLLMLFKFIKSSRIVHLSIFHFHLKAIIRKESGIKRDTINYILDLLKAWIVNCCGRNYDRDGHGFV